MVLRGVAARVSSSRRPITLRERLTDAEMTRRRALHRGGTWLLLCAAALLLLQMRHGAAPTDPLTDLAGVLGHTRALEPRLSIGPRHTPCPGACATLPAPGSRGHARVLRLAARTDAASAGAGPAGGAALHALGLLDLLWADVPGNDVDRSIQLLTEASLLAPANPAIMADLAAAHLVRFDRASTPADLLHAIDAADRALARDAGSRVARFNRVLAQERLGLAAAAARGWREYADAEADHAWAAEATRRSARLPHAPGRFAGDSLVAAGAPPDQFAQAGAADPQRARAWAQDVALPAWGARVLAADSTAAAGWLARAVAIGAGDPSVARIILAARHADAAARARLARLYVD
jgi:hypothetical protein